MAAGIQNAWDTTANNNATADSNIGWAEGQAPSTVNNSARAMMAAVAKFRKDIAGMLVTAGTSTAYTLTTNETLVLADGVTVTCRMSATNGASPTLNVDSTGAVAIQSKVGTAIGTGVLLSGAIYAFTYYAAVAAWVVAGAPGIDAVLQAPAGTKMLFATSPPAGWSTDSSLNNAAVRVVTAAPGADQASVNGFTTTFGLRQITQAMLPNFNLNIAGLSLNITNGSNLLSVTGSIVTAKDGGGVTDLLRSSNLSQVGLSGGLNGTLPSGGSGADFDMRVNYIDVNRATKD